MSATKTCAPDPKTASRPGAVSERAARGDSAVPAKRGRPSPRSIHALLPKVMRDVGVIGKSQVNRERNYRFRSIDDTLNTVQPVLVKYGISVSIRCFDHHLDGRRETVRSGRARTVYRASLMLELAFWAPDGTCRSMTAAGEGQDEAGDKATNKAMSAAMKYAILFGLMVPVGKGDVEESDLPESSPEPPAAGPPHAADDYESPAAGNAAKEIRGLMIKAGIGREEALDLLAAHGSDRISNLSADDADAMIDLLRVRVEAMQRLEQRGKGD